MRMISVIYVDDEPDLLDVARLFLEESGYLQVRTFTSAQGALRSQEIASCDAIISDYQMPEMDGIAFLKEIRQKLGDIPFILFTGRGREEVVIQAINHGADFYLQKGGDPEAQFAELEHKIRQAVKRKEAERSLQESEKRLSDIINFLPDATFAIDRSGHVIAWNRAIEDMTGVTAADMLGKGEHEYAVPFYGVRRPILIDLIFEPDNIIRERYAHIIHEKDILIADTTLPRPKGKAVTLMGKASPLYNRQGKVVGAIESIRDITDLKKAEHDLQRSEEWFRNLIQNSSDMIRIIGKDGRISYSSPSTRRILGYDRSALIGKDPFEFIHPDDREHARQAFAEVVKNTNPHSPTEYRLRHADGYYVDVEAVANNLLDVPDIDGVVVTVRPITERKRAEAALRESEEKFRGMADRISDIVLIVDKDFRLTYISPSFLKMTNRDASELLGKPLPITQLTPSEQEKVEAAFRDNQDLKTTGPLEISYTIPGRGPIILEFHGVPIQEGGVFFGVQLLAHDITNLRKTQDKLRSAYEHLAAVEQDLRRQYDEIAKSRQDLAESEKQYKTLFEGANDAILIGDRTTILNCNHSTEVLFGCSRDQIINHPITNFFTERQPDGQLSKEKASEKINATLAGKPQSFEWVQLRQDRTPVYVEVSLNRILIRGVYYVQGIVRDITERRKADVALRESESKFSLVFRNSPVALTLVSATDGVFVDVNDAFLRNTRYSREEVMGKTAKDLKLIPGQENRGRIDSALRSQQEIHGMEISCRIKTGEIRSCLISSSKIVMHGEPHILSTIEDITERKATEFAVQAMVRSIVGTTGLPSLRQITENVSSWLGADCVMIGEIHEDGRTVKVLSMLLDGKEVSGHIYPIKGTPFGNTVETGFCLFQDDIRNIFPGCKALDELTIRAYVGTPLRNSAGRVSGILCALSRNPLKSTLSLQEIIDIIAVKAAAEIESMQMTRALRESEQKFRSLVEYSLEGILILDFQGTILFANNSIARMLELHDCTGLMGRNVMEFVAPESRNDAMRDFGEVARGHDAYLAQYKVITAQGNEIYIESIGKIIGYEGKTADLVSIHEVTERKKAEDALSRSQHMLAEAMDLAHLVNWEYDVASGLFTFDDRFYALYGTTAEREGGNLMSAETYAREFVHPEDSHLVREEVLRDMATTDPQYTSLLEHRIIRRDGEIRTIAVRIGITKDAEGRTIKTHGANQDITDIRKAEAALLESEEKYRSLVETTPGMIWEIDPRGIFHYISPMVKTIMGFDPDELVGKSIAELIVEPGRSFVMQSLDGHIRLEGTIPPFEVPARNRSGREMTIEIRPSRITDAEGKLIGLRGVAYDVTERRRAEEALTRANRQLNLLGSITRHDLLNKITVILGNLKIAERKITDPGISEHLAKIRSATDAIKSQIEFTRIYQKIGTHEPQWIELETVMPGSSLPSSMTLYTDIRDVSVLADPMLERVFFNLLDNSIRHGEKVTGIHVSTRFSGDNLVIVWEDDGIGIPADDKALIFERGYGSNTGLGMFLAREILSLTGITIVENGMPGRGARFEITVPKGAYRNGNPGCVS